MTYTPYKKRGVLFCLKPKTNPFAKRTESEPKANQKQIR